VVNGDWIYWSEVELVIDSEARELAKELGGLPPAWSSVGAYLSLTSTTFPSFPRFYRASLRKLQQSTPESNPHKDRAMYSAFNVSFGNIKQQTNFQVNISNYERTLTTRISGLNFRAREVFMVLNGCVS
jgi:hypothetical protein